jgi:hypothetical protein
VGENAADMVAAPEVTAEARPTVAQTGRKQPAAGQPAMAS